MTKAELLEVVKTAVAEVACEPEASGKLEQDMGLDSLDRIEVCMKLERSLNIDISDTYVEEWGDMSANQITDQIFHLVEKP